MFSPAIRDTHASTPFQCDLGLLSPSGLARFKPTGGLAMERCLFSVTSKQHGWQLADQESVDQWYLDKSSAIRAADCMALVRYEQTGHPTGIKVQMATGEWVLMGLHG